MWFLKNQNTCYAKMAHKDKQYFLSTCWFLLVQINDSEQGELCSPQATVFIYMETFSLSWLGVITGIYSVEGRDGAKPPTMHGATPHNKKWSKTSVVPGINDNRRYCIS